MPTSSEARLDSDGLNSKLCCFVMHLTGFPSSQFTSIYLSIYLPIRLNTREGHQTGSGEPSGGGLVFFFFFFFLVCNVSCVSSE